MDVSSAAASISVQSQANVQAQASMLILKKALDLQQVNAALLLQTLSNPVQTLPDATVGTRIDTYV